MDLGPDKFLSDKDLQSAMKLLPTLSVSLKNLTVTRALLYGCKNVLGGFMVLLEDLAGFRA